MFGIGFPELILILALALIVVGPDKLPDLARSVAKTLVDLKKTAEGFKESLDAEDNPLSEIKPELEDAAKKFKETVLDAETHSWEIPEKNPVLKELDPETKKILNHTITAEQENSKKPADIEQYPPNQETFSQPDKKEIYDTSGSKENL